MINNKNLLDQSPGCMWCDTQKQNWFNEDQTFGPTALFSCLLMCIYCIRPPMMDPFRKMPLVGALCSWHKRPASATSFTYHIFFRVSEPQSFAMMWSFVRHKNRTMQSGRSWQQCRHNFVTVSNCQIYLVMCRPSKNIPTSSYHLHNKRLNKK